MTGLRVTGLCKRFRTGDLGVQALDHVSFRVDSGTFVAVIGYSGSGKTTLFRHIAGLVEPDRGAVTFHDRLSGEEVKRPRLGMMFQEPRLLPWLTVRENLLLALRRARGADNGATVLETLRQVGLGEFSEAYPDQLSGGMAQRVALARALCRRPQLLLMDEPFGALDALTRLQLQVELARLWAAHPMTVLCITHDVGEALILADRVLVMREGRLIQDRAVPLPRPRKWGDPAFEALRGDLLEMILQNNMEEAPCVS